MQRASTPAGRQDALDGRSIIRQSYERRGLTEDTIQLMLKSISEATLKQYCKPLEDWARFCLSLEKDPYKPRTKLAIAWLSQKFTEGASYSILNSYRSAIALIAGDKISRNPSISRLLKSAYNERPAKPKYDRTYDIEPLLLELERLFPLENLSISQLTDKLIVLLALITAHRKQTLSLINIKNIVKTKQGYEIEIPYRIKSSKAGQFQPLLILPEFK